MSLKVLIVDDEEMTRELLSLVLRRQKYRLYEAEDGRQALDKIDRSKPDVVILDVMMPRLDGIKTAQAIRANLETADLPIIMISAKSHSLAVKEGIAAGANFYMSKPVNQLQLVKNIELCATSMART